MIKHGQEILAEARTPFNRAEFHENDLVERLLSTAAEVQQRGLKLQDILSPFLVEPQIALKRVADNAQKQRRVIDIQWKLAKKFSNEDRLLSPEEFGVVTVNKSTFVALTSEGLERGSYNSIMSDDEDNTAAYTIDVDGQEVDTRTSMTRRLHRAMNIQALAKYIAISPDNLFIYNQNNGPKSGTWYTGDRPNALQAPFGYDSDIYPERHWRGRDSVLGSIAMRPTVEV